MVDAERNESVVAGDTRALLETLAAQAATGTGINAQELLLTQLGDADPMVSLVARYLAGQSQQADSEPSTDNEEELDNHAFFSDPDEARLEDRAHAFGRLREAMENIYGELETLRKRNQDLAAALGACYQCWGEDLDCHICVGTGHPGSSMPDKSLLAQLVVPAVQRLRTGETVARPAGERTEPESQEYDSEYWERGSSRDPQA
jgi:hypothetical protein